MAEGVPEQLTTFIKVCGRGNTIPHREAYILNPEPLSPDMAKGAFQMLLGQEPWDGQRTVEHLGGSVLCRGSRRQQRRADVPAGGRRENTQPTLAGPEGGGSGPAATACRWLPAPGTGQDTESPLQLPERNVALATL